jgi:hypothetical protein
MAAAEQGAGSELWFLVPPGWIELAAFETEAEATTWFDRVLAQSAAVLDEGTRTELARIYAAVRGRAPHGLVDSAGALVTTLPDDTVTLWAFTVRVLDMPPSGDVNPMAVVERFLAAEQEAGAPELADADLVETFRTRDGRDGVAIHTSVAAPRPFEAEVPGTDPEALGVVYAAVRLRRPPGAAADRLVLVTGVSPNVGQRLPMAVVAAGLTLSAQVRAEGEEPPPGRIDIDATGRYETRHEG